MDTDDELSYIDNLNGDQFETYMTKLLSKVGFQHMTHTPFVNDHGLDAYGYNLRGDKVGFQFKNYTHKVPYKAIYETLGGATFYKTYLNYVITNNYFTKNTYKVCHQMNHNDPNRIIILVNRDGLRNLINKAHISDSQPKNINILNQLTNQMKANHPDLNLNKPTSNSIDTTKYKICPKCKTKLPKPAKFCHVCGYKFNNITSNHISNLQSPHIPKHEKRKQANNSASGYISDYILAFIILGIEFLIFHYIFGITFSEMNNYKIIFIIIYFVIMLIVFYFSDKFKSNRNK